jgi:hypothetical protein
MLAPILNRRAALMFGYTDADPSTEFVPLEIHPNCLERLREVVAKGLDEMTVENNKFIGPDWFGSLGAADRVLPQQGKLREALHAYISETPVEDFVFKTLSQELYETQTFDSKATIVKLSELQGYTDLEGIANRLLQEFTTLPWEYALSLPLPVEIGGALRAVRNYVISEEMRLVAPDDKPARDLKLSLDLETASSLRALAGVGSELRSPRWDPGTAHLQIYVKGFIGTYSLTTPAQDAIDYVKAFLGLGIALRLFRANESFRQQSPKTRLYVHRSVANKWIIERTVDLDPSLSEALTDLALDSLDGRVTWTERVLRKLRRAFSAGNQSKRLALAGQWLFDSYSGTNELLRFVQAAVVLEILLGDKAVSDLMGLGELLRNRCAYLISKTNEERETILEDFQEIYTVRSSIVHAGKKRLNSKELFLFYKLRSLCQLVISKEIELLEKGE